MALQDEITRIKQAKADIKASIEAKGGTVGNGTIDTYASAIDNLPSGGSGGEDIYEYFSNVANAGSLNGRHLIKKLPMIDTSNVTSMNSTFDGWNNLEEIPLLDTSNVTSMSSTFRNCAITTIPAINTQNVSKFDSAFYGCSKLYELPTLNFKSVISSSSFVYACSKLTILGGIGFSGLNPKYNATCGLYRNSINTLETDKDFSSRFERIYLKP